MLLCYWLAAGIQLSHHAVMTIHRSNGSVIPSVGLLLALTAALPACGKVATETHPSSTGGGGGTTTTGETTTSSTGVGGGAGGETLTFSEGGTGAGGVADIQCDPAPALVTPVAIPLPAGVTADFAAKGRTTVLSMAPDGDAAVMFNDTLRLFVRRYHAGQWADFEQLAAPTSGWLSTMPDGMALVAGAAGRIMAVYGEFHDKHVAVCARTYDPASGWSGPSRLSVVTEGWWQDASPPSIAASMSAAGDAVVVLPRGLDATAGLFLRHFTPSAGWGDVETLSTTADILGRPSVVLHDDGSAVVAWQDQDFIVASRAYQPASGWGPVEQIDNLAANIRLERGPDQSTVGVWTHAVGPDGTGVATAVHSPVGGWGATTTIAASAGNDLLLATAADGGRAAAWSWNPGVCEMHGKVQVGPPGGAWAPGVVPGLDTGVSQITGLGVGAGGKVAVGWDRSVVGMCEWSGANLSWLDPASGVWQGLELDPAGAYAHVAVAPDGRALVAWERWNEPSMFVRWLDLPAP